MRNKLLSKKGESLVETLVSVLIASFAMMLLAVSVSTASKIITKSSEHINAYYDANEAENGIVRKSGIGDFTTVKIKDDDEMSNKTYSFEIYYYENDLLNRNIPVVSYKLKD